MRSDLAKHLIHFTKGHDREDAYQTLKHILQQRRLMASTRNVPGAMPCICFSEAPLASLEHGLINDTGFTRYAPFGLLFSKSYVFARGGRPVIYQPDAEFSFLPNALRWRHVRFDLSGGAPVDFTWEREWRLPTEDLRFEFSDVEVVLPDEYFRDRFVSEADADSFQHAWAYTHVLGEVAWAYDTGNPWRTVALKQRLTPT
ncbi:MAG TPA: hypothetical protein VF345_08460 [Chthoniobacterales bacterium]